MSIEGLRQVKWKGNNVELAELLKALIAAGKLENLEQKIIFQRFAEFLNFDLKEKKGIQNITDRADRGPDVAKFLPQLISSLETWNTQREEKKSYNSNPK